jgi:MFS family permease
MPDCIRPRQCRRQAGALDDRRELIVDVRMPAPEVSANAADTRAMLAQLDSRRGWLMVAVAFVSSATTFGVAYSFGAFLKPMAVEFGAGRGATAAVFSITAFLYFMLGPVTGHLSDRFGPRRVLVAGAIAMGLGLCATAFINRLWLGYLTYGAGVGVGAACGYVPMIAVVGGWFLRYRTTALGIAVAGIGCGTLGAAPLAALLIQHFGWRATDVMFGAGSAALLLGCALVARRAPLDLTPAPLRLAEALRTPAFTSIYASSLLCSIALYVPFVFLPDYAHRHGASEVASAALVGMIGAASIAGRMGLGALGARAGLIRLYQLCFLALGLSFTIWLGARSYSLLVVFALTMGASYGGYVALSPAVMAELYGTARLGVVLGVLYTSCGMGALIGPPLAGVIIDRTGGYGWAIGFATAAALTSFVVLLPLGRHQSPGADALAADAG